jgi:hypothetical protein
MGAGKQGFRLGAARESRARREFETRTVRTYDRTTRKRSTKALPTGIEPLQEASRKEREDGQKEGCLKRSELKFL